MATSHDVLVIGAGFSGIVLAAKLAAKSPDARIVVVEKTPEGQAGVAYLTNCPAHLLNVPATSMTALADQAMHFVEWSRANGYECEGKSFMPRYIYREYLSSILAGLVSSGRVTVIRDEATSLKRQDGFWICDTGNGTTISAKSVVLAFGNFRPAPMPEFARLQDHPMYFADPWHPVPDDRWKAATHVGMAGSGLTAIDVVLRLEEGGFKGHYTLISRHGLLPYSHRLDLRPIDPELVPPPQTSLLSLLSAFRESARLAEADGSDWRTLFDAIRPNIATYWKALPPREQARFLSHLRSYWDVHRHRVAPEVSDRIEEIKSAGRLTVVGGALQKAAACGESIDVPVRLRHVHQVVNYRFDALFNCTGSPIRASTWPSPILSQLVGDRICAWNEAEMGLRCDEEGQVYDAANGKVDNLFVLGLLRRGLLWESTAVPDLRAQAAKLSDLLVRETR